MGTNRIFHINSYKEIGESHLACGKTCEDNVRTGVHPVTGVAAAVVCDGAGSCSHAREGSETTAAAALEILLANFDELYEMERAEFAGTLLDTICGILEAKAEELDCNFESLSSTLVCSALAPDGRYIFFHVGDGVITACDKDGQCRILSQYHHEIALNFTTFVTIPDTEYNYGKGQGNIASILLMSDGPEYFMTYAGRTTPNANLLLQLNCLLPEEQILAQLQGLTLFYKQCGMYDDASYAIISDKRKAGGVFSGMDSEFRGIVFNLPRELPRRVIQQYDDALTAAALCGEEGISEKQLVRLMRVHSEKNVIRKMEKLTKLGVMKHRNGKYYF